MKRVYIAGKYSDDDIIKILANIRTGQQMAAFLMSEGFAVCCPFLDYQLALTQMGMYLTKAQFQANSMAWVDVSDALLVLPGWETSGGTKREIARAKQLGIPVFYSLTDLEEWDRGQRRAGSRL